MDQAAPIESYAVAVRELCEFAAKQGDLDLRFTPSPDAQEGMAGHRMVAARRGSGYQAELKVTGEYPGLKISGRIDGFDAAQGLLEEVKTHRGDVARIPQNHRALHLAQAKVYGWLLCRQLDLAALTVSVVYFEVDTQQETAFAQRCSATELRQFCESLCQRFLAWAQAAQRHRQQRDEWLAALQFPHAAFRAGQRQIAENVFKALRAGRCLMAQAPTGIGKTLGTLFPVLKAAPGQGLDKLFFLSAKSSGRGLALQALQTLRRNAMPGSLRVIELVARDKSCEHPDKACHGESCPLARGFYDRLPAARQAAACEPALDTPRLREIALQHQVCPYYLSQEMVRWSDVVVGDYNYFFDSSALLHGLTQLNRWCVAVLVDEAHNLVDRARSMYSAALDPRALRQLRKSAPAAFQRPLNALHRAWRQLARDQDLPYRASDSIPAKLLAALRQASAAIGDGLNESPQHADARLLEFHFDLLQFLKLAESFGDHSLFDQQQVGAVRRHGGHGGQDPDRPLGRGQAHDSGADGSGQSGGAGKTRPDLLLSIRNVIPAPFLEKRFALSRSTVLFSATLAPPQFYADTLGLPESTAWLDVPAPFSAEQLDVRIVGNVSTRYARRGESLAAIADLMARQYRERPGNYLAFFSSFDYLQQVLDAFYDRYPGVPSWAQTPRMEEAERADFLQRFQPGGQGIGFAVLGGAFAEGIDLPGDLLIGAFIATLGLPPFSEINEQMKRRMQNAFGAGDDYTYLFPGLRKVVQAAGRVIRTPTDTGCVYLIDDRFARPRVRQLLPGWWAPRLHAAGGPGTPGPKAEIDLPAEGGRSAL